MKPQNEFAAVLSSVKPTPKQEILHAFRHNTTEPSGNFLSAKEVISRLKESAI